MERPHRHRPKGYNKRPSIQPCFSGVSAVFFTLIIVCIFVAITHMEGPFMYLDIIYTLYTLFVASFVFHILVDLLIWDATISGSPGTRIFMARFCPILCIGFSVPPAALLWHTKNRGGFKSENANMSLVFSLLLAVIELFHLLLTVYVYRNYGKDIDEHAVQFSYTDNPSMGPSPASSIRSGRIEFIMNRSRNSLASIDSSFMHGGYGNMVAQRTSALEVNRRFWDEQRGYQYPYEGPPMRRHDRRASDSSIISASSAVSKRSDYSVSSKRSTRSSASKAADNRSIVSKGSNRSRKSRSSKRGEMRVEEELEYQPGYFMTRRMW